MDRLDRELQILEQVRDGGLTPEEGVVLIESVRERASARAGARRPAYDRSGLSAAG